MLIELLVATCMVALTVVIHGWGLALLGRLLHAEQMEELSRRMVLISPRGVGFTIGMALGLLVLHGIEIWLYAVLYHRLGAIENFRSAVYFSTTTYSAIGYGDEAMADKWKLLGGIEGINGVLLLGWSTAFLVAVLTRLRMFGRDPAPGQGDG